MKDYDSGLLGSQNDLKTTIILEFDQCVAWSIKSLAVNKKNAIKTNSRFFNGRMVMFTKLFLTSFIYKLVEVFYFPDKKVKKYLQNTWLNEFFCTTW